MGQDSSARSSAVRNGLFDQLPKWAKVGAIAAVAVIVVGAVTIPVAATAVDQHNRQLAHELAQKNAAAEKKAAAEAAEVLKDAKDVAAGFNSGFDGFTISLASAVSADAAAAFEDARVKLADAIKNGGVDEVSGAMDAVADALDALVTSAKEQADALIEATPIADLASTDALIKAVANLKGSDDVKAAFTQLKAASDAVIASQAAGQAAADAAAAAAAAAEQDASGSTGGEDSPSGGSSPEVPSNGGASGGYDPAIISMWPAEPFEYCGENPEGQVIVLDFHWGAREGNTVDIFYALTDTDAQATGGFSTAASSQGSSGSVGIPRTCPVGSGTLQYLTIKLVASNANGSATAYYWGL